jgi:two-component system cell cycle sensor histidine kinase/response regulator CckA
MRPRSSSGLVALLDALPLGAYVFELEDPARPESLRITFANRKSAKTLGIEPSSVIGTLIGERFPQALEESGTARAYRDAILEQTPRELGAVSSGGEGFMRKRFAVAVYPVAPDTAVVLFDDISSGDRRRDELAAIVDSSDDAILSKTLDGEILTWNKAAERTYGYGAAEAIGKQITMLLPLDRKNEISEILVRLRAGERIEQFETTRLRKDGATVEVALTVSPVKDSDGCIVGAATIAREIGDRKAFESHLQRLAAIVETSQDAIVSRDAHGLVTTWNEAAEHLFGYSAEEMVGKPIDAVNVGSPFTGGMSIEQLREALGKGERPTSFETRMSRKDRTPVEVSVSTSPITDASGTVVGAAGVIRDMTGQRRLEERLRQAQKLESIGSLAGGVAHDFNNILTIIRSSSDILRRELDDESLRVLVQQIDLAAGHAAALTGQLLAFSRQQVLQPQVTDLNTIVEATLMLVERLIGEQIQVIRRLGTDLAPIHVDRGQLQQVILNLGINARDAMPSGGTLVVRTADVILDERYASTHVDVTPGPYVELEIADSGIGMHPDTASRIFDPFFTTKSEGTGLGLATVHGIVKQSGGHITVYSEPAKGTTFTVYLPASAATAATHDPPADTVDSLDGEETILVVEDNEMLRPLILRILADYSYTILEAANGTEALAVAQVHPGAIDLLLTDVVMPEMNGGELAERLIEKHPGLNVLFSSGYPADSVVRAGIEEARVSFIQKPYVGTELVTKIRTMLNG